MCGTHPAGGFSLLEQTIVCICVLLTQVLSGSSSARLPLMFQGSNFSSEDLAVVLPLCLSDSNFPLYVAEVESQLSKLAHGL